MVTTFLPVSSFSESAKILDRKRLNQQCNEVEWLLKALRDKSGRVYAHPCAKMWEGYENALVMYGRAMCLEMGPLNDRYYRICSFDDPSSSNTVLPHWLGLPELHASHRGNLLRKDPVFYGKYGWIDSPLLPYVWPGGKHANDRSVAARSNNLASSTTTVSKAAQA